MTDINKTLNIILADDDEDDCSFFKDAIEELHVPVQLTMVHDGEELILYLEEGSHNLPHALFLDLNMPRKSGFECLTEIKKHSTLKKIPVIIFSTSYEEKKANFLFDNGADYYICKPADFDQLKEVIHRAILVVQENSKSTKENFLITNKTDLF